MNESNQIPEEVKWKEGWSKERAERVEEQGKGLADLLLAYGYDKKFILTLATALNAAEGRFDEFAPIVQKLGVKKEDLQEFKKQLYDAYALTSGAFRAAQEMEEEPK